MLTRHCHANNETYDKDPTATSELRIWDDLKLKLKLEAQDASP